jgi:hypothetical protein
MKNRKNFGRMGINATFATLFKEFNKKINKEWLI